MGIFDKLFGGGNKTDWKQVEKVILEVNDGLSSEFSYNELEQWRKISSDFDRLNISDFKKSNSSANFTGSIIKAYEMKVRGLKTTGEFLNEVNRIVKEAMIIAFGANIGGGQVKHEDEEILIRLIRDMKSGKFGNPELVNSERLNTALNTLLEEVSLQYEEKKVRGTVLSEADKKTLSQLLSGRDEAKAYKMISSLANSVHMGTYKPSGAGAATGGKVLDAKLAEIDAMVKEQIAKREKAQEEIDALNQEIAEKDRFLDEIADDLSRDTEYEQAANDIESLKAERDWKSSDIQNYSNLKDGLSRLKVMIENLLSRDSSEKTVKWIEEQLSAKGVSLSNPNNLQALLDVFSKEINKVAPKRIEVGGPKKMDMAAPTRSAVDPKIMADREARIRRKQAQAAAQAEIDSLGVGVADNDAAADFSKKSPLDR